MIPWKFDGDLITSFKKVLITIKVHPTPSPCAITLIREDKVFYLTEYVKKPGSS